MSIKIMSLVWEHSKAKGSVLLTLLAIADYAHDDGTKAFPSIETLAAKTRMSTRQTQYNIRALEEMGEITVHQNRGRSNVNVYQVMIQNMQSLHVSESGTVQDATEKAQSATEKAQPIAPNPLDPSINHQLPIDRGSMTYTQAFETFWKSYPSQGSNKKQAYEAWKRLKPDAATQAAMMAGLERWKRSRRWKDGFVKSAHIWIRDRWWEDDPPMDPGEAAAKPKPQTPLQIKERTSEGEGNPLAHLLKAKGIEIT
jgi:hypothetical protein